MFCWIKSHNKTQNRNTWLPAGVTHYWNNPRYVWIYWLNEFGHSWVPDCERRCRRYRPKLGQRGRQQAAVSRVAPCLLISLSRLAPPTSPAPSRSTCTLVTNYFLVTYVRYLDDGPSSILVPLFIRVQRLRLIAQIGFVCFRLFSSRAINQIFYGQIFTSPFSIRKVYC